MGLHPTIQAPAPPGSALLLVGTALLQLLRRALLGKLREVQLAHGQGWECQLSKTLLTPAYQSDVNAAQHIPSLLSACAGPLGMLLAVNGTAVMQCAKQALPATVMQVDNAGHCCTVNKGGMEAALSTTSKNFK